MCVLWGGRLVEFVSAEMASRGSPHRAELSDHLAQIKVTFTSFTV